jgi:hypothetical protein
MTPKSGAIDPDARGTWTEPVPVSGSGAINDNGEMAAYYWARNEETGQRYAKDIGWTELERETEFHEALKRELRSVHRRLEQLDEPRLPGQDPPDANLVSLRRDELKATNVIVQQEIAASKARLAKLRGETEELMLAGQGETLTKRRRPARLNRGRR